MSSAVPHQAKPVHIIIRNWIGFVLGVLLGPTLLMWFLGCLVYPMVISVIPIERLGLTYESYKVFLARSVRNQQKEIEFYGWSRTERAYDVADAHLIKTSFGFLEYEEFQGKPGVLTGAQGGKQSDVDNFWGSIEALWLNLCRFCAQEWLPINRAFFLILFMRLELWAAPFALVVLLFIGCFFAGEYTSRERFEENTPPSSGRTKYWLFLFSIGGITLLNLPGVPLPIPFLWVFAPMAMLVLYSTYKARSESIEFV